ncbi:hypothetical protein DPMN_145580 [Dreissena polymorpha]|uniref:Uncharacterized protein n=1 Tax=Dreissena polymorpha TaxID=45954 RepID=A0A9D4F8V0_DREPO|nr:hypothetical protein DPMN_145580 [Dreissena polymorpha]
MRAPAKEQRSRWHRRNAAETVPVPEPASAPVPGPQPEATPAVAPPAKRKRTDDNAANGEVVDFCDIFRRADGSPRGHNAKGVVNNDAMVTWLERFRRLGPFANTTATPKPAYLWNGSTSGRLLDYLSYSASL